MNHAKRLCVHPCDKEKFAFCRTKDFVRVPQRKKVHMRVYIYQGGMFCACIWVCWHRVSTGELTRSASQLTEGWKGWR